MELLAEVFAALQTIGKEHEAEPVTEAKKGLGVGAPKLPLGARLELPIPPKSPRATGGWEGERRCACLYPAFCFSVSRQQ